MAYKKKKKVVSRSISSIDNDDSNGLSCGLWILLIASGLAVGCVLFTLFQKYILYYQTKSIYSIDNYKDLITRAEKYTLQYKNMSFARDFDTSSSTKSTLFRGSKSSTGLLSSDFASILSQYKVKKDLIIGIAQNMDPKNLVVFCATATSIIDHDKVDIVLLVNTPTQSRNREILSKYRIITVEYSLTQTIDPKYSGYHASSLRWIMIQEYISKKQDIYGRILMLDVRDSYFQDNPFETLVPSSHSASYFYSYAGVESKTIKECGWNGGWVRDCFGREMLDDIGSHAIICSGVSIGSTDVVSRYVEMMHDVITGVSSTNTASIIDQLKPKFPSCERNGVDQGIHNVLFYKDMIPHSTIFSQSEALVMNMQAGKAHYDTIDYVVKNSHDIKVTIVHQYDRYPDLQAYLFKKYVDWVDVSDADAVWNEESSCKYFKREDNKDMFKGMCDLRAQGGATSPATCCSICEEYKQYCQAFTFSTGTCYLKSCGIESIDGSGSFMVGATSGYRIKRP